MTKSIRVGGSFAPAITPDKLREYEALAENAPEQAADYMRQLAKMLRVFWETGESKQNGTPHPSGVGQVVPLEDAEVQRIWDYVPWNEELNVMGGVFAKLPKGDVRNAAYHLLWYGRELTLDREPITKDKAT